MTATRTARTELVLLRDGTPLADLLDEADRTVAMRVLTDQEIYELEQERIFGRCWQFVAHESELPDVGSYVTRWMADDPVIVTRDTDGAVHVLLNVCSHKGAQVCRAAQGRTLKFTCPYHGWVYDTTGAVASIFAEPIAFGDPGLDKSRLGLRAARVGTYRGFVFATWDDSAPSLEAYLGEFAWYLDTVFGAIDGGVELIGPPARWEIPVNWKVPAENLAGDSYHVATTHRSVFEIGLAGQSGAPVGGGPARSVVDEFTGVSILDPENGHGTVCLGIYPQGELEDVLPYLGVPAHKAAEVRGRLEPGQIRLLREGPPIVGNVFPNFSFINSPFSTELDQPVQPMVNVRVWLPRGPHRTEVLSWPVVYRGSTPELRDAVRQATVRLFSPTGNFEQDDLEIWSTIGRVSRGHRARERRLRLGATAPADNSAWDGPLEAHPGALVEDNQWNFYRSWLRRLTTPADGPR